MIYLNISFYSMINCYYYVVFILENLWIKYKNKNVINIKYL